MALPNNPTQLEVVKAIKDLEGGAIIELEENGSTTAGTWLAKTDKITALQDGQLFLYKIAVAGATTTTLNITANGTALGAITIYRVGTTKLTTQYGVGQYLLLIYNTTNSCFRVVNDYDANSYAYVRQYQAGSNAAGSGTKYPVLTRYNLTNKNASYDTAYSRYHTGVTIDTSNGNLDAPTISENGTALSSKYALASAVPTKTSDLTNDSGFTTNTGTITGVQLNGTSIASSGVANVQALPNFSLNISHQSAGNPRQVKFLTVDYNTAATYFKMSATSCHDNGTSYQFLEDIIIGCTTGGTVVCNVYKYCQQAVTLDNVARNYGDVFYVIDTTNKKVDFFILCGQYASSQFTPATKIGNTTIAYITQYTGTAAYYSSGTKVWADGDSALYVRTGDLKTVNGNSLIGSGDLTVSADLSTCLKNNVNGTIVGSSSDTALFLQSKSTGSFIGFKNSSGTTLGYLGVNSSKKPIFYDTADRELALKSDIPTSYVSSVNGQTGAVTVPSMPFTLELKATITTKTSVTSLISNGTLGASRSFFIIPYNTEYGTSLYNKSGISQGQWSSIFVLRPIYDGTSDYYFSPRYGTSYVNAYQLNNCKIYQITF